MNTKEQQTAKIYQIRHALYAEGISNLNQQAAVLGLPRSTTYVVMTAQHKTTGLSSKTLRRMLSQPLPAAVRAVILEYIEEKRNGSYGHGKRDTKKFVARMGLAP